MCKGMGMTRRKKVTLKIRKYSIQGRIHGYQSCMPVGRSSDKKWHTSIRAETEMQKMCANAEKSEMIPMDGWNDKSTDGGKEMDRPT